MNRSDLEGVAADLEAANKKMEDFPSVKLLEEPLRSGILNLAGSTHDIGARLRFGPTDPLRLFRSIAMYIDEGKRGIAEASLGSANVALIALKLAEFAWRRAKNERNYSLLCIEEPEAHLHPQLQRTVFDKLFQNTDPAQALIVTRHSPTLAAVTPLVLAGPGSGKTKTLTTAMTRTLMEDFIDPRGVACITYNNECAIELEMRLAKLGIKSSDRSFIGSVHSFALTQVIAPYARCIVGLLPDDFRVATRSESRDTIKIAY